MHESGRSLGGRPPRVPEVQELAEQTVVDAPGRVVCEVPVGDQLPPVHALRRTLGI